MLSEFPNLFVIGAPKCGTTAIYKWLSTHPEILVSIKKEPNFFNTDHLDDFRPSLEHYHALFPTERTGHKYRAEASAWYLYSELAVPEIMKVSPAARFVICLRNPADLVFSLHAQQLFSGEEDVADIRKAWGLQSARRAGTSLARCGEPKRLLYEDICRLGDQLARLYQHVDRGTVHLVFLDDICTDPSATFGRLARELGLAPHRPGEGVVNGAKRRRSPMIRRLARRLALLKERTGIRRSFGVLSALDRWNSVRRPWDKNEGFRRHLQAVFRSDIDLLEQLTGRDLAAWREGHRIGPGKMKEKP